MTKFDHLSFFRCSIFSLFVIFFLYPVFGTSQFPHYVISHYTSENGLPQNSVKNILFDRDGYCWIATEAGLVRFDNQEFKVFGQDNILELKDERIQVMSLDTAGNVFVKNLSGQSVATIPANNFSSPIPFLLKQEDSNYYPTNGYLTPNEMIGALWDSLLKESTVPLIRRHVCLRNGDIYLTFKSDIYYIIHQKYYLLKQWPVVPVGNIPLGSNYFLQLWKGNKVAIWENGRLLFQSRLIGSISGNRSFLKGNFQLFWCPNGTFIYAGKALYKLTLKDNKILSTEVLHNLDIQSPACVNYLPSTNTYYIGSFTDGLYVIKISDFISPVIPKASGIPNFYAIAKTPDDQLVVKNTVIPRGKPAYNISIHGDAYITAYSDSAGNVYYETSFYLNKFNVYTGQVTPIMPIDERLVAILPVQSQKAFLICTHNAITLVTEGGKTFWKKMLPIKYSDEKATGLYPLSGDQYMLLTNKGAKWYNLSDNKIYKSVLDSLNFRSFYKDQKGRIWLGSDGNGAYMYEDGQTYKLPLGASKSLKTVQAFIDDGRGFFWLPTNNGLFRININQLADYVSHKRDDLYMYTLNNRDGLLTNEFNGGCNPAYQWLMDSTLVLPSMNGLVEFKPFNLKINYPDNRIFLDGIKVDTTNISLTALDEITKLEPDFDLLSIKVSCPYFGNPSNLQLEYTIQGNSSKNGWIRMPASGLLTINKLPAGDYQIIIRKSGYSSASSHQQILLNFKVLPYFYNAWWFYILMLFLFSLIGYIFSKQRIKHLVKQNLKTEKIVAIRTSELKETTRQLKNSEAELRRNNKIKEQVIAMVLHDLRSPFRFLGTISKNLVKNFKEENPDSFFVNLKKLNKSIGGLWGFIDQFFSWAVVQQSEFQVKEVSFSLQDVFEEVASFYEEILSYNGNQFLVSFTDIVCRTDKDILSMILRNLVDNANKYTEDGIISLHATIETGDIQIIVKDTGRGLNESQIRRFMDASRGVAEHDGTGSILILKMLTKIGSKLDIETTPGEGSTFKVTIHS